MTASNEDMKGRAKEAIGDLTDDKDLQHEGKADQAASSIKEKLDDTKEWLADKVDEVKDKLKKD